MPNTKKMSGRRQSTAIPTAAPRAGENDENMPTLGKRKADQSGIENVTTKRLALANITNAMPVHSDDEEADDEPNLNMLALAMKDPGRLLQLLQVSKSESLGEEDFDSKNYENPFQEYAMDIFRYLKEREAEFPISKYMRYQDYLTKKKRASLVSWMMEVMEKLKQSHETIYLAVKIVDLYLCRVVITRRKLQLLGAAALLIASKYFECHSPLLQDFNDFFDQTHNSEKLERMERRTLRTIDFDLGIPISYSFLCRYARCVEVPRPTFMLARYILDLSLMDYKCISYSDSQMASAALFIALRMHGGAKQLDKLTWTPTLELYSDYKLKDFAKKVIILNAQLHIKPGSKSTAVRVKYSFKRFYKVAMVPLLTNKQLFQNNLRINRRY